MATKAYLYTRFSTAEQEDGDSERRQSELGQRFAKHHGLELDESYRDLGVSAFRGKNRTEGALGRFLGLVRDGKIAPGSYLLVENFDRLSRDHALSAMSLIHELIAAQINIATLQDNQIYSTARLAADPSPLFLALAKTITAHEESAKKSQRVAASWDARRQKAGETRIAGIRPTWLGELDGEANRFPLIPERVAVVRRIFQMSIDGLGFNLIARTLNREGVPTLQQKEDGPRRLWQPNTVRHLLGSEAVLGRFQPHRLVDGKRVPEGSPIDGYFPRIIADDVWYRAQAAQKARGTNRPGRAGSKRANLFAGYCRCHACGGSMALRVKAVNYLQCTSARFGNCTNRTHYRLDPMEEQILQKIAEVDLQALFGRDDSNAVRLQSIRAEIVAKTARRDQLISAMDDEDIPALVAKVRTMEAELKTLKATEQKLIGQHHVNSDDASRVVHWVMMQFRMHQYRYQKKPEKLFELRTKVAGELRRAIDRIDFHPEGSVRVHMRAPEGVQLEYVFEAGKLRHAVFVRNGKERTITEQEIIRLYGRPIAEGIPA